MINWVRRPKYKWFLRLEIGGEVCWNCRRWIVDSQSANGFRDRYVASGLVDANKWFNALLTSGYVVKK